MDANYYDFYRRDGDRFGGSGIINHLEGGVGLFGSVGRLSRQRVYAVYPSGPAGALGH